MDDIEARIKMIIGKQSNVDISTITPETKLGADLGMDSLDVVEVVMAVEEEFNLDIPGEEADKVVTLQNAVDLLRKRLG